MRNTLSTLQTLTHDDFPTEVLQQRLLDKEFIEKSVAEVGWYG